MAKTYIDTVKYLVYAHVEVGGLVDKPDIVGAIFGQTEGLLGDELDLRDLQKNGRIGRIEVEKEATRGNTTIAVIKIPSSLDMVETCIIAAALETVDRVGPCEAKIKIQKVEDTRSLKRKVLVDRAKNLLRNLINTEIPESKEISDSVRDEVKVAEITTYGRDSLPAGPSIDKVKEVVFVEGRADVLNLLKNDITNVIALGGARVPPTAVDLSKKKETTVFLDGDRGGDIILRELENAGSEIDFVARAPKGKEVEELTRKEIIKCLRNRIPYEQNSTREKKTYERPHPQSTGYFQKPQVQSMPAEKLAEPPKPRVNTRTEIKRPMVRVKERKPETPVQMKEQEPAPPAKKIIESDFPKELDELKNTLKARLFDENLNMLSEIKVRDVIKALEERSDVRVIIFDGIITQRLVDLANSRGVRTIVGGKIGNVNKKPEGLEIVTRE
ncbi:DNA primase [Candidatus Micrarchaeota archaeon]|nr:DNA primase [Candidatus Micrarchaeota archaeon]